MKVTKSGKNVSLTQKTFNGFIWMFTSSGFQGILQIIVLIILARLLSPEDFGIINIALIIIGFSEIFLLLGIGPAIVQLKTITNRHIRLGFTLSVLFGIVIVVVVWFMSVYIADFFKIGQLESVIKALVILFPLQSLSVVPLALLQRELKFKVIAKINVISYFFGYAITGVLLAYLGMGIWSLIIAHITMALLNRFLLFLNIQHSMIPYIDKKTLKELLFFGGGITVGRISNYLALQGDNIIVGRMLDAQSVGVYGRAYQMMNIPAKLFGEVMDKVLFPAMSKIQDDKKRLSSIYKSGITITAIVILPISIFIFILAPEIVEVLFGKHWLSLIMPLKVFAIGMLFRTSYKFSESVARAKGAVYRLAYREGIYALAIFIGVLIGVKWGVTGAAIGVVGALFIQFMQKAQLSIHLVDMTWGEFLIAHKYPILFAILLSIEVILIVTLLRTIEMSSFLTLLISSVIYFISYILLFRKYTVLFVGGDLATRLKGITDYLPKSKITKITNSLIKVGKGS